MDHRLFPRPRRATVASMASALILFCALAAFTPPARAATVEEGTGPCTFTLDGPITGGEYDTLAALKGDAVFWSETQYDPDPVLCLNSEGGSLAEGSRIARFVYDNGVQTRVGDGAICHSICAMIFMMGNKQAGPTSVEENRILHVGGDLAFHSPSITLDDRRQYTTEQTRRAYELGIQSILSIVELANSLRPFEAGAMVHPGLIGNLLATPASDLYHIRTIEQALVWDIGLEGLPETYPQRAVQRQMVCEIGLMRGFRRPSDLYAGSGVGIMTSRVFDLAPLPDRDVERIFFDYETFEDEAESVYGYRYSALPMECKVRLDRDRTEVCGFDSNFGHGIGDCEHDRFVPLPSYARYHPLSDFRTITRTGIAADVLRGARCTWRSMSGAALRDQPCTQAIDLVDRPDRDMVRHTLHWPSGDRTVVEIAVDLTYEGGPDEIRVDGRPAERHGQKGACLRLAGRDEILCATAD